MMNTNVTNPINTAERVGWHAQPDGRGTFDLVWGCLFTIFLCVWTIPLSLKVPPEGASGFDLTWNKLKWMTFVFFSPEAFMGYAGGQWSAARLSVKKLGALGYRWTLAHAFFADMGGFRLKLKDDEFPLNAERLYWLLQRELITFPEISEEMVKDQETADPLAKTIVILQAVWFVVQCMARLISGLSLTLLELSTIAYVACAFATSFFLWSKPRDVSKAMVIEKDVSVADLVGPGFSPSLRSSQLEKFDTMLPSVTANVRPLLLKCLQWYKNTRSQKDTQDIGMTHSADDLLPSTVRDRITTMFLAIGFAAFGAIYIAGWRIDFPTAVEAIIWRVAICCVCGLVSAWWVLDLGLEVYHAVRITKIESVTGFRVAVCVVVIIVYLCCRLFLIIESFVSLRALPVKAYQSVNWTGYIPHLH